MYRLDLATTLEKCMDKRFKADPRLTKNATGEKNEQDPTSEEDANVPVKINEMLKNVKAM